MNKKEVTNVIVDSEVLDSTQRKRIGTKEKLSLSGSEINKIIDTVGIDKTKKRSSKPTEPPQPPSDSDPTIEDEKEGSNKKPRNKAKLKDKKDKVSKYVLKSDFDGFKTDVNVKFDKIENRMENLVLKSDFDGFKTDVNVKFDKIENRMENLVSKSDFNDFKTNVNARMDKIENRIDKLENKIDNFIEEQRLINYKTEHDIADMKKSVDKILDLLTNKEK
ncbi:MAG: hypothetical protein LBH55_02025 [Mycoplasmataceae bacterium]|jgi:ribosome-associated translation inhibitor RaiA|nr:hypothetical protein [Mycoplasmataceae bacterium]